jgi:6-phosphofructokinase 1
MRGTLGILTGGGDCPGLNAVIRAVTKTATSRHGFEVIGFADGFAGVVEDRWQKLGFSDASDILTRGGPTGTSGRRSSTTLGAGMTERRRGGCSSADRISSWSAATAARSPTASSPSAGWDRRRAGAIDNDIRGTTALVSPRWRRSAVDRLHSTAQSHHRDDRQVMGRYGWIAPRGMAAAPTSS